MANLEAEAVKAVQDNKRWFMVLGIILIVVGFAAILFPWVSSLSATLFVGWLLVIGGVIQIFHAFKVQGWSGFLWQLLIGILETAAGLVLLVFPLAGVIALTVFLAAMFLAEGLLRIIFAFRIKPHAGWGWMLAGGILSAAVGVLLWAELPGSALWALGLLVGINFLMAGWTLVMLAAGADRMASAAKA